MGNDSDSDEFSASLTPQVIEKEKEKVARRSLGTVRSISVVKKPSQEEPTNKTDTATFDFPDNDDAYEDMDSTHQSSVSPIATEEKSSSAVVSQEERGEELLQSPAPSKSPKAPRRRSTKGTPKQSSRDHPNDTPSQYPKRFPKKMSIPKEEDNDSTDGSDIAEWCSEPTNAISRTSTGSVSNKLDKSKSTLSERLSSLKSGSAKEALGFSPPKRVSHKAEGKNLQDKSLRQVKPGGREDTEDQLLMDTLRNDIEESVITSDVVSSPTTEHEDTRRTDMAESVLQDTTTKTKRKKSTLSGMFTVNKHSQGSIMNDIGSADVSGANSDAGSDKVSEVGSQIDSVDSKGNKRPSTWKKIKNALGLRKKKKKNRGEGKMASNDVSESDGNISDSSISSWGSMINVMRRAGVAQENTKITGTGKGIAEREDFETDDVDDVKSQISDKSANSKGSVGSYDSKASVGSKGSKGLLASSIGSMLSMGSRGSWGSKRKKANFHIAPLPKSEKDVRETPLKKMFQGVVEEKEEVDTGTNCKNSSPASRNSFKEMSSPQSEIQSPKNGRKVVSKNLQEKLDAFRRRKKWRDRSRGDTSEIFENEDIVVPSTWDGLLQGSGQKTSNYLEIDNDTELADHHEYVERSREQHLAILERAQNRGPYKYKGSRGQSDCNKNKDHQLRSNVNDSDPNLLAKLMGIRLQGSLEKKGKTTIWSTRHFVLKSKSVWNVFHIRGGMDTTSSEEEDRLEIYEKSVPSYWGPLPSHHKRTILLRDILSVMVDPAPAKKGREFTIVVSANKDKQKKLNEEKNESSTVNVMQLRAESSLIRMEWTDALNEMLPKKS